LVGSDAGRGMHIFSRLLHIKVLDIEKVWEPLGLKYPRRGHEICCARSRRRVQIHSSQPDSRGSAE